jgi:demethylmacrocin O-methyltransferase
MNLIDLAIKHRTDMWGGHSYVKHYENYLAKFKKNKVVFLEIGIGGYSDPSKGGSSLRMWSEWLEHPETVIIGADLHEKNIAIDDPRVKIRKGSQIDAFFLEGLHREFGDFDVILDDGSHNPDHVIATFSLMYSRVKDGGIYIVEDTQTSYWDGSPRNVNIANPTYSFFKSAPDWINYAEIPTLSKPKYLELHTVGAHFFHNLIILEKDLNDEASNIVESRLEINKKTSMARVQEIISRADKTNYQHLSLTAHIGSIGDVCNPDDASIVTDRRGRQCIQGFLIACKHELANKFEYRAKLHSGIWTDWVSAGTFVGTRGEGKNLLGFGVRLKKDSKDTKRSINRNADRTEC